VQEGGKELSRGGKEKLRKILEWELKSKKESKRGGLLSPPLPRREASEGSMVLRGSRENI